MYVTVEIGKSASQPAVLDVSYVFPRQEKKNPT